jgi:hypothetical protein
MYPFRPRSLVLLVLIAPLFILASDLSETTHRQPGTDVSGVLSTNTVWDIGGSPYIVKGDIHVQSGVSLSIEPGVVVRFDGPYSLYVKGTMDAEGTGELPILFTSNKNQPAAGDWGVIDLMSESLDSMMVNTIIEYGGYNDTWGWNCERGAICVNTSSFLLSDSIIRSNGNNGLVLSQSSAVITHNTFAGNSAAGIRLDACRYSVAPCTPTITGNQFNDNLYAIYQKGPFDAQLAGNIAANNGTNGYVFGQGCEFAGTVNWEANDLTYVVESWCDTADYYSNPLTLTIQAGAVIKLSSTLSFDRTFINRPVLVRAVGTEERPIFFTSIRDDSVGGDTNNDGDKSLPADGDWGHIRIEGLLTQAFFQHVTIRYAGYGDLEQAVYVFNEASATLENCWIDGRTVGLAVNNGAALDLRDTRIEHNAVAGVRLLGKNTRLVINNSQLEYNGTGIVIDGGTAVVSNSLFSGNTTGVHVGCTTCSPVISPGNKFIGTGQKGIDVSWPADICVEARDNWWGSVSGPLDASSALDACNQADNPGTGVTVSDGVKYSPWAGGVARPQIIQPGCGITARNRPVFYGLATPGSVVSFFDGGRLLGSTISNQFDYFNWQPTIPLTEGLHDLTAISSLGGGLSLPSKHLPLYVDSSLLFDPAGVTIMYLYHNVMYTQPLRNLDGCADVEGDYGLSINFRAGAEFTVTIPIQEEILPITRSFTPRLASPVLSEGEHQPPNRAPERTVTITNYYDQPIIGFKAAAAYGSSENRVYGEYGVIQYFPGALKKGDHVTLNLADGQDLAFVNENQQLVHRAEIKAGVDNVGIPNVALGTLLLDNQGEVDLNKIYIAKSDPPGYDYIGGEVIQPARPLKGKSQHTLSLPEGVYDVLAVDKDGHLHIRRAVVRRDQGASVSFGPLTHSLSFKNKTQLKICGLRIYAVPDGETSLAASGAWTPDPLPVDLAQLLSVQSAPPELDDEFSLDFDSERYFIEVDSCAGSVIETTYLNFSDFKGPGKESVVWDILGECANGKTFSAAITVGTREMPLLCNPKQRNAEGEFRDCSASLPAETGKIKISICHSNRRVEVAVGNGLIDPDGYVYNADLGVSAKLQGVRVACEELDDETGIWSTWPAAYYNDQVNPQITANDGYYAFFVPPGLYRIRANAAGFLEHLSPVLAVVSEVVHYNVPLQPGEWVQFIPLASTH